MAKKVQVDVDVNTSSAEDKIEGLGAQIRRLKKELRNTPEGTAEWKNKFNEIDDLEDEEEDGNDEKEEKEEKETSCQIQLEKSLKILVEDGSLWSEMKNTSSDQKVDFEAKANGKIS